MTFITLTLSPSYVIFGDDTLYNNPYSYPAPYGNWFTRSRHQIIILSSELQNAGVQVGAKIYSLGFFVKSPNYIQLCPCTLKIKEVNYNEVGDYFDNNDLITAIGYNPCPSLPINGWTEHTFSSPWTWNGNNILIDFYYGATSDNNYTYNASTTYTTYSTNLVGYNYTDAGSVPTSTIKSTKRPNIRILVDLPSSNKENKENKKLSIKDKIMEIYLNDNWNLKVYNVLGNKVFEKKGKGYMKIYLNVPKGIYMYELNNERGKFIVKF